jgi:hypothetical protein
VAAILGGNLYARVGMNPALREVSDATERGKVTNRAWRRYGVINGLGLAAIVAGWGGARLGEALPRNLSPRENALAIGKDAAVASLAISGVALGLLGMKFATMEPDGAVPLEDGSEPADAATPAETRAKRVLDALGAANLVSALALVGANAALSQANFRRPPARRLLRRRY